MLLKGWKNRKESPKVRDEWDCFICWGLKNFSFVLSGAPRGNPVVKPLVSGKEGRAEPTKPEPEMPGHGKVIRKWLKRTHSTEP